MHARTETRTDVSLPAPEGWQIEGGFTAPVRLPDGRRVIRRKACPLARARLIAATVVEDAEPGPDGEVITRRARVWKADTHPTLRALPVEFRAAAMEYAAAVEQIGASRGQNFASTGGGSGGGASGPCPASWAALEVVRKVEAILAGRSFDLILYRHGDSRGRTVRLAYLDALKWVAVDGQSRPEIARRLANLAGANPAQRTSELVGAVTTAAAAWAGVALGLCSEDSVRKIDPKN